MKTLKFNRIMAFMALIAFAACQKDDVKPDPQPSGDYTVKMTDGPGDYAALNVEIKGVEVYQQHKGWIVLTTDASIVNVSELCNGKNMTIAHTSKANLQGAAFTKIKIKFGDENKLKVNAKLIAGPLASESYTEVYVKFDGPHEIVIDVEDTTNAQLKGEILLDFNIAKSIYASGKDYVMKPAIKQVKNTNNGVKGKVSGTVHAAVFVTDGKDTFATYIDAHGYFMLKGMKAGKYTLMAYSESKAVLNQVKDDMKKMDGVLVAEGSVTEVAEIKF